MRKLKKAVAVALLSVFMLMILPVHAYAQTPGQPVLVGCGTGDEQQDKCAVLTGSIVWSSGGTAMWEATTGEFIVVWVFFLISWEVWSAILGSSNVPNPTCTNCTDGFRNAVNGVPQ